MDLLGALPFPLLSCNALLAARVEGGSEVHAP